MIELTLTQKQERVLYNLRVREEAEVIKICQGLDQLLNAEEITIGFLGEVQKIIEQRLKGFDKTAALNSLGEAFARAQDKNLKKDFVSSQAESTHEINMKLNLAEAIIEEKNKKEGPLAAPSDAKLQSIGRVNTKLNEQWEKMQKDKTNPELGSDE